MEASLRILVADDDSVLLEAVTTLLRSRGYDVHGACDGAEALALCRAEHPDLMVLDWTMPQIEGPDMDIIALDADRLLITQFDISAHGVGAAMHAAAVQRLTRTLCKWASSPAILLDALNRELPYSTTGSLFSMFCGVLECSSGRLVYARAGHPCPRLWEPGGRVRSLSARGVLVGVTPDVQWTPGELVLPPGSRLLIYSDGLIESGDYGVARLDTTMAAFAHLPLSDWLDPLLDGVRQHAVLTDDTSLLALERLIST